MCLFLYFKISFFFPTSYLGKVLMHISSCRFVRIWIEYPHTQHYKLFMAEKVKKGRENWILKKRSKKESKNFDWELKKKTLKKLQRSMLDWGTLLHTRIYSGHLFILIQVQTYTKTCLQSRGKTHTNSPTGSSNGHCWNIQIYHNSKEAVIHCRLFNSWLSRLYIVVSHYLSSVIFCRFFI